MFSGDEKTFDYAGQDLEALMQADNYYRWIIDTIKPYVGDKVIEVGSGAGSFSKFLRGLKPTELTLIEPSKSMHTKLTENTHSTDTTKVTVLHGYLKTLSAKVARLKLDTAVYINVFEHIDDDQAEAKRVAKLLESGGHLIIFVPALQGLYSNFDKSIGHYRRYTKKDLRALCKAADLEIVRLRYMDMPGILPWWFSFVLMKRTKLVSSLVRTYDNLCVPIIRTIEGTLEMPVGKNLLLIARKK